jgi:hypothetical protein
MEGVAISAVARSFAELSDAARAIAEDLSRIAAAEGPRRAAG